MKINNQPWIKSAAQEILFILLPPFYCIAIVVLFPKLFNNNSSLPTYWWVILILLIDVAHVYSTLFKTYFNKNNFFNNKSLYTTVPLIALLVGILCYSFNSMLFWSLLAYLAVFHFIRQQYGFMRIYSRKENNDKKSKVIDTITIYSATIYPIIYWHLNTNRNFNWFMEGDFLLLNAPHLIIVFSIVYSIIIGIYLIKEIKIIVSTKFFNVPKNLIIVGTILSWYLGIVHYNGDMAFTLFNVVSHGIPYMALIWIHQRNSKTLADNKKGVSKFLFSKYGILIFLLSIFLFAYIEEALWDITLWNEHKSVFNFNKIKMNETLLNIFVPLLTVPQLTHYILDGFIWKKKSVQSINH